MLLIKKLYIILLFYLKASQLYNSNLGANSTFGSFILGVQHVLRVFGGAMPTVDRKRDNLYCMMQIFDGENIDKFDEFLSIHQHFPYQNFPLIIFCHLPARPLFAQGVIASIHAHAKIFPVQIRISV